MKTRKPRTLHRCRECGFESASWRGKCPGCEAWQTLEEVTVARGAPARAVLARPRPLTGEQLVTRAHALDVVHLGEVAVAQAGDRIPVSLREVDRVLGGGLVPGA